MRHKIKFHASGDEVSMKWIGAGGVPGFVQFVRGKIGGGGEYATGPGAADDIPGQIRKLAELRDQGILSEDELEKKKEVLLERM